MNLRDLQYLVVVADHLHFGKAARACNVSQPTLSMQLKKLEEQLGVQFFERTNKSVMLTPIGRQIVGQARRILEEAEQIKVLAKAAGNPLAGDLRMGVFPTLAPYLLPSLVPKIRTRFPDLNLLLVEEKTDVLVSFLKEGQIDCALLAMPVIDDVLECAELFIEPFTLAVSVTHPLAKRKSISVDDLKDVSMLLLDEGHCLRDQALQVCQSIGLGEAKNFRATSLETLRHMVASGNTVTLMPKLAARSDDTTVCYIPFKAPVPSRTIGLYWRKTSTRKALYTDMHKLFFREKLI